MHYMRQIDRFIRQRADQEIHVLVEATELYAYLITSSRPSWLANADYNSQVPTMQEASGTQRRSQASRTAKATPKKLVRIEEEDGDSDKEDSPDEIEEPDDSDFEA